MKIQITENRLKIIKIVLVIIVLLIFTSFTLLSCYLNTDLQEITDTSLYKTSQYSSKHAQGTDLGLVSNIRLLTTQQEGNSTDGDDYSQNHDQKQKGEQKDNQQQLLSPALRNTLIVFFSLLFIVLTVIILYKKMPRILNKTTRNAIKQDHNFFILPSLLYSQYQLFFGKPRQHECVICLQEFSMDEQSGSKQKRKQIVGSNQDKIQRIRKGQSDVRKQVDIDLDKVALVKITYCGHMMHSYCLDRWLQKEMSCPVCRQKFQYQNIKKWQQKLQLQLMQKQLQTNKVQPNRFKSKKVAAQKPPNQFNLKNNLQQSPTFSNQVTQNCFNQQSNQIEQQIKIKNQIYCMLPDHIKLKVDLFSKIIKYHRKKQQKASSCALLEFQYRQSNIKEQESMDYIQYTCKDRQASVRKQLNVQRQPNQPQQSNIQNFIYQQQNPDSAPRNSKQRNTSHIILKIDDQPRKVNQFAQTQAQ